MLSLLQEQIAKTTNQQRKLLKERDELSGTFACFDTKIFQICMDLIIGETDVTFALDNEMIETFLKSKPSGVNTDLLGNDTISVDVMKEKKNVTDSSKTVAEHLSYFCGPIAANIYFTFDILKTFPFLEKIPHQIVHLTPTNTVHLTPEVINTSPQQQQAAPENTDAEESKQKLLDDKAVDDFILEFSHNLTDKILASDNIGASLEDALTELTSISEVMAEPATPQLPTDPHKYVYSVRFLRALYYMGVNKNVDMTRFLDQQDLRINFVNDSGFKVMMPDFPVFAKETTAHFKTCASLSSLILDVWHTSHTTVVSFPTELVDTFIVALLR
jgi:hypothetical protein